MISGLPARNHDLGIRKRCRSLTSRVMDSLVIGWIPDHEAVAGIVGARPLRMALSDQGYNGTPRFSYWPLRVDDLGCRKLRQRTESTVDRR